jgi:hypothetical protein
MPSTLSNSTDLLESLTPVETITTEIDQYDEMLNIGMFTKSVHAEMIATRIQTELEAILSELDEANRSSDFQRYLEAVKQNLEIRLLIKAQGVQSTFLTNIRSQLTQKMSEISTVHKSWLHSPEVTQLLQTDKYRNAMSK